MDRENDLILTALGMALDSVEENSCVYSRIKYAIRLLEESKPYHIPSDKIIIPEMSFEEFDFNQLLKPNSVETITGVPVKIDKIIRDITSTTILGISGTLVVRGIRLRIVWDPMGNVMEYKRIMGLLSPYRRFCLQNLCDDATTDMFRLVQVQKIEKKND